MTRVVLLALLLGGAVPAGVPEQDAPPAKDLPDFELDVLPVLTRAGCNAGGCHGAAKGQNGFRLSLLGYEPDSDYEALALEHRSRRVNRARPEESLMLLKAAGKLDHGGETPLAAGTDGHRLIAEWVRAGAPRRTREDALASIDAGPARILSRPEALRVEARYSSGATRDVTPLALFSSNDDAIVSVDADGRLTPRAKGETAIVVRYGGHVVSVLAGVPYGGAASFEPANVVDERLAAKWRSMGVAPAREADASVFVRRAFLDVIGTLPTPDEARAYAARPDRAKLVDALLARPEFAAFWTLKFCEWLRVQDRAAGYPERIRAAIERDAPLTEFVRGLVAGEHAFAPTDEPRLAMEFTIQSFHGFRMQCANCHNHPLERFSQDAYHGLAAFYARLRSDGTRQRDAERGELTHPITGKAVAPRLPDGTAPGGARRAAFAEWLVRDRAFARAWANRLWGETFGRGLAHPVDDMRASNPPSVPPLLDELAERFAREPKLRPFLRMLLTSRAYALDCRGDSPERFFARAIVKPLPAEVLADAMSAVLGGTGPRAIERTVGIDYTLEAFGRCPRTAACADRAPFEGSLKQALHVLNDGRLAAMKPPAVEELYWRALSREPSASERAKWAGLDEEGRRDLAWALMASKEFSFRH